MDWQEHSVHFPDSILTPEIEQYATDVALLESRYIFTERKGRKQLAYCTHCGHEFTPEATLIHNTQHMCPSCGSDCVVKASGKGHKYLYDSAYFVYYLKSVTNRNAVVAVGVYVSRDYGGDYRHVQTRYLPEAAYLFLPGIGSYLYRKDYWWHGWSQAKTIYSRFTHYSVRTSVMYSRESLATAVAGTPYQYSAWEQHDISDMTQYLALYEQYPGIEYLTKMGFKHFVESKIYGRKTRSAIAWNGTTPMAMLRLTKPEIREARTLGSRFSEEALRLMQLAKRRGYRLSAAEAATLGLSWADFNALITLMRLTSPTRIQNYVAKQQRTFHRYQKVTPDVIRNDWYDYIQDCKTLGLDLTQDQILFPRDLHTAHQSTIKQVEYHANEIKNQKIKKRAEKLGQYRFEQDGLLMRPAESADEMIAEGKILSHCVGGYVDRYVKGETSICFIRRQSEPDKPFITCEFRNNRLVQARGLRNATAPPEVVQFLAAFEKREEIKAWAQ